jgi:hypothetical protein
LGVLGPSFAKSGDERKFQDEKSTQGRKTRGDQTYLSLVIDIYNHISIAQ